MATWPLNASHWGAEMLEGDARIMSTMQCQISHIFPSLPTESSRNVLFTRAVAVVAVYSLLYHRRKIHVVSLLGGTILSAASKQRSLQVEAEMLETA